MKVHRIPEATVMRLSIYSRYLHQLSEEGVETISSGEIAKGVGVGSAQVRKDLAYFGEFGTRGVGYNVEELFGHLMNILGLDQKWKVIIIGAGKLGSALALYQGFNDRGFTVSAILDNSEERIGQQLANVIIEPMELMEQRVKDYNIKLGIVTVPAQAAQDVTDKLISAGVRAILNFSPQVLRVPSGIILRNVDLSVNMEVLSFNLALNNQLEN